MTLQKLIPILYTEQLKETVDFYEHTLGFTCVAQQDNWEWAQLQLDSVELMLSKPNQHFSFDKPSFTGSFYIKTDKVDELWEKLKNHVKVCYPIENFSYGMREFAIYDNNGYIIQFGQEI